MIIDLILDRACGIPYYPQQFYCALYDHGTQAHEIQRAMDCGTESDIVRQIATYIIDNEYNPNIIAWVMGQKWLEPAPSTKTHFTPPATESEYDQVVAAYKIILKL